METYSASACTCHPTHCTCQRVTQPVKCPDCGTWFQYEHRCTAPWRYNTTTSVDTTWRSDYVLWNLHPNT